MKLEAGWSTTTDDLDTPPEHILRVSGTEGFHRRFLRREASGKMDCGLTSPHAVGDLPFREDALDEAFAVPFDGCRDTRNVSGVDPETNDGGHDSMILPTPAPGFAWRDTHFGPALVCLPLEGIAPHIFTTRLWEPGDEQTAEAASAGSETVSSAAGPTATDTDIWSKTAHALALAPDELVRLKQVHGAAVARASRDTALERPNADIAICDDVSLGIAVQTADCVPLLIADRRRGSVAAAHAGWRGLARRVPVETVHAMAAVFGSHPTDLIVAIGPSVGACCYEVGRDVRRACEESSDGTDDCSRWFADSPHVIPGNESMPGLPDRPREGHAYFDGWNAARDQLLSAGVPAESIHTAKLCTASHSGVFWSYRREGSRAKRLVAAIRPLPGTAAV